MADRAVGTATSYPVDKQHVGVEDRELARGHWAGAPDNSYVRDSTIKYGDTTSGFYEPPALPPPPPPPATEIGAVIVMDDRQQYPLVLQSLTLQRLPVLLQVVSRIHECRWRHSNSKRINMLCGMACGWCWFCYMHSQLIRSRRNRRRSVRYS